MGTSCGVCYAFTGVFGTAFSVIGICVLLFGYMFNVQYNADYMTGTCLSAPGVVFKTNCQVRRAGCWNCYQTCWTAFYGLSAVPGRTSYFFIATYFDEQSANNAINYQIGYNYGTCYYRSGGYSIILQLADVYGTLVAGIFFTVAAALIFTIAGLVYCHENDSCTRNSIVIDDVIDVEKGTIEKQGPVETDALKGSIQYTADEFKKENII